MSRTMHVIMNHTLNEDQRIDAEKSLGVSEIKYPPQEVLTVWKEIPSTYNMWELREHLQPVFDWLKSTLKNNDVVLIAGEHVATFMVVSTIRNTFVLHNIKCLAATTDRQVVEEVQENGAVKKTTVFKHVRYRSYY
jgi:hypothetical protein